MTQARWDAPFDRVPDEIMLNIFSYLGFSELVDVVQNVCERWRRLSRASVLWTDKELIVTGKQDEVENCRGIRCRCVKMENEAIRIARRVPELRRLTVKYRIKVKALRKLCMYCANLTHLEIQRNNSTSYSLLKDIFERCQKIKHLCFVAKVLADKRRAELVSRLEHLSSLRVVWGKYRIDRPELVELRVLADGCPRLEEIDFDWHYEYDEIPELEYFFEAKRHSITSAILPWMIDEIRCVVTLLKQCNTCLKKLELVDFFVPHELEDEAFEALGALHSLHELRMIDVSPYKPQLLSLLFQPGRLTQLRRLQLDSVPNLLDETVVAISQGCPSLRELRITFSEGITDAALREIDRLKCLEILELSGCSSLGGAAMVHIANLPALHTLVLQGIKDLAKLQPSLLLIVCMNELRVLDIMHSYNVTAVPFVAFPTGLVNLRELRFSCQQKEIVAELQHKMPDLKIVNTVLQRMWIKRK